jgi:UPF0716 protein FxsA
MIVNRTLKNHFINSLLFTGLCLGEKPLFKWLFAAFLVVPLLEIYLLLTVGGQIGVLPTVVLVVLTAVVGMALIRIQGVSTLLRLQEKLRRGEPPAEELMTGAALLVAGALLLTPGFFTDTLGFLLLTPSVRRVLFGKLVWRLFSPAGGPGRPGGREPGGQNTLEGEYRQDD